MAEMSRPASGSTVRQTIVETLEAPRLSNIRTEDFVKFKERRAIYERKANAKNQESGFEVPLTSYRDSIDESVLDLFVLSSWVDASCIEDITEEQLKAVIKDRSIIPEDDYDLGKIERVTADIKLNKPSRGSGLENQVWQLCLKYVSSLRSIGYDDFLKKNLKLLCITLWSGLPTTNWLIA